MKRLFAMLLTGCMVFQAWMGNCMPVQGAETSDRAYALMSETQSILDVEVRSSRLFPYQGKVTVQIDGEDGNLKQELEFGDSAAFQTARFHLPAGKHTVLVRAEKYADYTQEVQVDSDWITKITVCSARTESQVAPGWIRIGDVNKDRIIDEKDTTEILGAIRTNPGNAASDLNGNGITDLADLQFAVQSMGENQESAAERHGAVKSVILNEGTTVDEGSMEDYLNNASPITLRTGNNEAISETNPVGMNFVLAESSEAAVPIQGIVIQAPTEPDEYGYASSEITNGTVGVVYVDTDGTEQELSFSLATQSAGTRRSASVSEAGGSLSSAVIKYASGRAAAGIYTETDGSLVLDFGSQIAVKRVIIRITGTKKTEPLINIAKVEFVNDMESRIGEPELNIPTLNTPVSEDQGLLVSWNAQSNITGYEVCIRGPVSNQPEYDTQIVRVSGTQHKITSINNNSLKNYEEYTIKVRSVNGDWCSPWSEEKIGIPKPGKLPAPPDYVVLTGGYRSIRVSWKDMGDSAGYMVYYKKSQEKEFYPAVADFSQTADGTGRIEENSYLISGLEDKVEYSVYVISWNEHGWSGPSLTAVAETISIAPPILPEYKLLNTSNGEGVVSAHITDAAYGGSGGARMEGSALDTDSGTAWGLVDNDYGSYWAKDDWDDGCAYPSSDKGMTITLDGDYPMNYITYAAAEQIAKLDYVRVGYWDTQNPSEEKAIGAKLIEKMDENNHPYYIIKLDTTITANKIHLSFGRVNLRTTMMVGEIRFYRYDSLEDDIMGLYEDEMHTMLRSDVTEESINDLQERLDTPDEESGEKHPLYRELELELKTAREILAEELAPSYEVDNRITARKDGHLGFGGLNAWQPLGKTVNSGDSLLVYVGHNTKRTGDSTDLQLIFTQNHSEAAGLARTINLKIGRNEITVPQITTNDFERGGQVYISYTGNSASDLYAVRISGGSDIPVLSVYGKTGEERRAAIETYVGELEEYVKTIEQDHSTHHTGTVNEKYDYDPKNCVLNATDIMMREMMYSLPATQVFAGIQNASDKATKLDNALKAMEQTMRLFYQHKGLSDDAGTVHGNNMLPAQHLNIRYMRMFAGAFMYASGNHIGIEWDSALLASAPNDWSGFGWGIAHEIGHNINQGSYAVAEITNNYFSQLLTGNRRYDYAKVYEKVTSGTTGRASNVFTQLAMYWQLHLAFDNNTDDRYLYDSYEEQFDNLFFARVDTYSRNPVKTPQSGMTLNGDTDQNLMRLSCAAANKNILPFFERWGMTPDETTLAYAGKYGEPEEKALYYVNEDARNYRVAHPDETESIKNQEAVSAASVTSESNRAEITISTDKDADLILGYEVSRSMISNGEKKTEVIGFVPIDTAESTVYTDTISSINNRVMEYEVRAVDKYLNYSNAKCAGSVKIQTDGVLNKASWTIETDLTSEDDASVIPDEDDPDSGYNANSPGSVAEKKVNSIEKILDNDRSADGTYNGSSEGTATITIDMHKTQQVTALKYQGSALEEMTIEVSGDGTDWITVKEHYTSLDGLGEKTIWFDSVKEDTRESWIGTYDARYVRLTLGQTGSVSIQEIEICGPSGDNLEFITAADGQSAVGVLREDYQYGGEAEDVIPKGSLVFVGAYKGNPAYNVVVLYDTDGNVIGEKDGNVLAGQVILADVPEDGDLGETSDGRFVYYVEPGQWEESSLKQISGVRGELYRVDDALTLEGERIVSDTQVIELPDTLPEIVIQGGSK